jgi:hypothetical protein
MKISKGTLRRRFRFLQKQAFPPNGDEAKVLLLSQHFKHWVSENKSSLLNRYTKRVDGELEFTDAAMELLA